MSAGSDNAGVAVHPPILYLAALALGCLVEYFLPLWSGLANPPQWALVAGGCVIAAGFALLASAIFCFVRAGTNVPTNLPSTVIVTAGPYGWSRNPIYIGLTLVYAGIALTLAAAWALILLPAVIAFLSIGVIAREEAYLQAKFPREYGAYRARVRRWL